MTTETLAKSHLDNWREATPQPANIEPLEFAELWERYGSEWVQVLNHSNDLYSALGIYSANRYDRRTGEMPTLAPSAVVVVTTGFGAPLGEDGQIEGRPSEHPERRRLRVVMVCAEDGSRLSRLEFADNGETSEVDDGTGLLADTLDNLGWSVWGNAYGTALLDLIAEAVGDADKVKKLVMRLVTVLHTASQVDEESEGE